MLRRSLLAALLLFAFIPSPFAQAEDPRMGLQTILTFPQSDLKTWTASRPGLGLGLHLMLDYADAGEVFRPRIEFLEDRGDPQLSFPLVPGSSIAGPPRAMANRFQMLTFGLDSMYFFDHSSDAGAYGFIGVGLTRTKLTSEVAGEPFLAAAWPQPGTRYSDSSSKPAFSLGGGYQVNRRFGVEARVAWTRGHFRDSNLWLTGWSLAGTYRFPPLD